jgi:hypothetical protein
MTSIPSHLLYIVGSGQVLALLAKLLHLRFCFLEPEDNLSYYLGLVQSLE